MNNHTFNFDPYADNMNKQQQLKQKNGIKSIGIYTDVYSSLFLKMINKEEFPYGWSIVKGVNQTVGPCMTHIGRNTVEYTDNRFWSCCLLRTATEGTNTYNINAFDDDGKSARLVFTPPIDMNHFEELIVNIEIK